MASTKHAKPKDRTKAAAGFTKAGPNSRSSGKNRHRKTPNEGFSFEAMYADRRRQAADNRAAREAEADAQRQQQVDLARQSESITKLKAGTTAHTMAHAVLNWFAVSEPEKVNGQQVRSRTAVAEGMALQELSDDDVAREGAVKFGRSCARNALQQAFAKLKNAD